MSFVDAVTQRVLATQQAQVISQVHVAIQSKALDAARQQGEAYAQLIEQAAQIGKSVDTGKTDRRHRLVPCVIAGYSCVCVSKGRALRSAIKTTES